ncbi:HD domain-containing phosphohydrolase [Thalassolituus sp. LLYu03]|uniref:HD domain-containing phosphohydrolase n=1 Tax=Thalassolituus sp. LLYu03 TaxID=3421656 RepID=UPI003D2A1A7F
MAFSGSEPVTELEAYQPVPRVLLVDDEPNVLKAIARSLRQESIEILTAPSGADALAIMREQPVDLLISDMRMPGMSGADLLAQAAVEWPKTRRVLLTGYADLESTIKAVNQGQISSYLNKPWDDLELRRVVGDLLHARFLELENEALTAELALKNEALEQLNANLELKVRKRTEELNYSYEHMVTLVSSLASQRDHSDNGASLVDALMAQEIAGLLGMNTDDADALRKAVMLSGLGRIGFTDAMLSKPYCDYDAQELQQFRQWPVLAEAALFGVPALRQTSDFIRHQFERFDGSGFPDALAGEHIPLGARVLAVVRDYSDWLNGHFNGVPCNPLQARHEIEACIGKRYDPKVVEAFVRVARHYQHTSNATDELCVSSEFLQPGMVLSRDLFSARGMVLLKKNHKVDANIISKMQHLELLMDEPLAIHVFREAPATCDQGGEQ